MKLDKVVLIVREKWVANQGIRLQVLDSNEHISERIPVLFIPGAMGSAESYLTEMAALVERRCVALSVRGHGKSDAPESGYSFENLVSDIETVVQALGLKSFCLYGFSLGAALGLGYAVRHPDNLAGLIIGDYPARYPQFSSSWASRVLSTTPPSKHRVVKALQKESREVQLWDRLGTIKCPTLIMNPQNPQNLLVALSSGMSRPFITFASYLTIPTAASLLVTFYILKTYFARGKGTPWLPFVDRDPWYAITDPRLARLSILALSFVVIGALLMEALHLLGIAPSMTIAEVALGGGVLVHLLSSRRRELLARVDWSVLVFFAGMFVVMRGAWEGVFRDILSLPYFSPHSLGGIFLASLGFSQLLSNVPFVALYSYNLRSQSVDGGTKEWLALASGSTVAGNLTILAAASNVIIQEAAESRGAKAFTFWEFLRVGAPVTAATALIYYAYLVLV